MNRIRVVNVRCKFKGDDVFAFVCLSDGSEMTWQQWINGGCEELKI
jgi:hypothetical protein